MLKVSLCVYICSTYGLDRDRVINQYITTLLLLQEDEEDAGDLGTRQEEVQPLCHADALERVLQIIPMLHSTSELTDSLCAALFKVWAWRTNYKHFSSTDTWEKCLFPELLTYCVSCLNCTCATVCFKWNLKFGFSLSLAKCLSHTAQPVQLWEDWSSAEDHTGCRWKCDHLFYKSGKKKKCTFANSPLNSLSSSADLQSVSL